MSERQFVTTEEIEKYQELLKEQGINAVSGIYRALAKGTDVDKPRNLAKSVTVG